MTVDNLYVRVKIFKPMKKSYFHMTVAIFGSEKKLTTVLLRQMHSNRRLLVLLAIHHFGHKSSYSLFQHIFSQTALCRYINGKMT